MSAISFSPTYGSPVSHAAGTFSRDGMNGDVRKIGHILIADKDPAMLQMVTSYFAEQKLPTSSASTRGEVNQHLAGAHPSLIVLDLQLGQGDGLDLLRSIRARSDVPVIITSHRPDEVDLIVGFELGADDYIVKPLSPRELLARVRALLRRQEMARGSLARNPERGGYRFNGWRLDRRTRTLIDPHEAPVSLSNGEYTLLLAFLEAAGRPLTREHLLQATRVHEDIFDRSVDVQVSRLRRKLEIGAAAPRMIQTVHGVGYNFVVPVEPF